MSEPLTSMMEQQLIWQGKDWHPSHQPLTHSGYPTLDNQLIDHGWSCDSINEIYVESPGLGELQLVAPVLAELSEQKRWIIWIAPPAIPNAPALRQLNINIDRILIVHSDSKKDRFWALEQALQSGSCSGVLGWCEGLSAIQIRRLKLAAKRGNSIAFLFRPLSERALASPANNRMQIQATSVVNQFCIDLFKRDGGWPTQINNCLYQDGFSC
ncbi:translesion DNA synthesis-associated protein ImuA [Celerinatantimonas yamalensis]|uniref:Translesion DNA synthesis-associated protein ImuA n=1 Tax=Celerinatantimonas yamalensis TaxID=559956 RepID=A0ABW9G366_9GAMM